MATLSSSVDFGAHAVRVHHNRQPIAGYYRGYAIGVRVEIMIRGRLRAKG